MIAINITSCGQSKRAYSAARRRGCLAVEIKDRGRGTPPGLTAQLRSGGGGLGVSVAGMRERLQQLGGTLVERTNASVHLIYDVRNWPTDHVEYVSPLKGEAFEATSSDGFGFPQDCGGRHYAWRGSGHVAGEFSSDGRSVSGREEWNYAAASGDELRLFFEWKGTRR